MGKPMILTTCPICRQTVACVMINATMVKFKHHERFTDKDGLPVWDLSKGLGRVAHRELCMSAGVWPVAVKRQVGGQVWLDLAVKNEAEEAELIEEEVCTA